MSNRLSFGELDFELTFEWDADNAVRLGAVSIGSQKHELHAVPAVEILTADMGHVPASSRIAHTQLGCELRYLDHQVSEVGELRTLVIRQAGAGLQAELRLTWRQGAASVSSQVTVTNVGQRPVVLRGVTSWSAGFTPAPVIGDALIGWDRITGVSDWLGEGRWTRSALRGPDFPSLEEALTGHNPRGALKLDVGRHLVDRPRTFRSAALESQFRRAVRRVAARAQRRLAVRRSARTPTAATSACPDRPMATPRGRRCWRRERRFETVPATIAVRRPTSTRRSRALTAHRRAARRPHPDNAAMPVVFNDYMNTLNGDPTTDKLLPLIDAAADAGRRGLLHRRRLVRRQRPLVGQRRRVDSRRTTRFPGGLGEVIDRDPRRRHGPGPLARARGRRRPQPGRRQPAGGGVPPAARRCGSSSTTATTSTCAIPPRSAHLDAVVDRLVDELGVGFFKLDYNIDPGPGTDLDADSAGRRPARAQPGAPGLARRRAGPPSRAGHRELRVGCDADGLRAAVPARDAVDLRPAGLHAVPADRRVGAAVDAARAGGELGVPAAGHDRRGDRVLPRHRTARPVLPLRAPQPDDRRRSGRWSRRRSATAKSLRADIRTRATRIWPLGLPGWDDDVGRARPARRRRSTYVSIWRRRRRPATSRCTCPHLRGRRRRRRDRSSPRPSRLDDHWDAATGTLTVRAPDATASPRVPSASPRARTGLRRGLHTCITRPIRMITQKEHFNEEAVSCARRRHGARSTGPRRLHRPGRRRRLDRRRPTWPAQDAKLDGVTLTIWAAQNSNNGPRERRRGLRGAHRRDGRGRHHPRPVRAGRADQGRHRATSPTSRSGSRPRRCSPRSTRRRTCSRSTTRRGSTATSPELRDVTGILDDTRYAALITTPGGRGRLLQQGGLRGGRDHRPPDELGRVRRRSAATSRRRASPRSSTSAAARRGRPSGGCRCSSPTPRRTACGTGSTRTRRSSPTRRSRARSTRYNGAHRRGPVQREPQDRRPSRTRARRCSPARRRWRSR